MPGLMDQAGLAELATLVRDCLVSGVPRRALLVRTDLLPPSLSRPHHLRLAAEALEPLAGADRARRYDLDAGRVCIGWKGDAPDRLRLVLEALERLLQDAPLDAPSLPEFARLFDLPRDGAALLALASSASLRKPAWGSPKQDNTPEAPVNLTPPVKPTLRPLDLGILEAMEARLAKANVARFARRRMVCRKGTAAFGPAWEVRHLNIDELIDELAPGCNPYADPWLFRRLTRTLDRRLLALLSCPAELKNAGPFSLNLNVSGILSQEFLKFDGALPSSLRGHTVLDLEPADVLGDLPAYRFARAFARARDYRVLLRGLTPTLLALLDVSGLDVDFAELRWSADLAGLDPALLRAGTTRWVLGRVDDARAIAWGVRMGIGLFQGDAVAPGALERIVGQAKAGQVAAGQGASRAAA